ncbi:HlyD family secretion protein [Desulfonatronum thiosulfatophilum]|uniref:HlyD family secretion protein n=1 Tax=Desulfonatronum thiosulfatophilum TaxID=617002 RepID=A0A1G6C0Q8_9BACT|nr:efflux RND transporter periplasmic adaptor subunit [Desulfonatronum thiosulfatophilum]SDB26493.1 HlyD family secretion protein [Desulfonatronum thiosulfatophilum]
MIWRKRIIYALILAGVVALLVWSFRPSPILVDTEPVSRGRVEMVVEEEGRTRVADRYVLSSPLTAQTQRVTWEVGDAVQAGDVLAVLMPLPSPALDARSAAEAQARVRAAESAVRMGRAELDAAATSARFAESDLERLRRLADQELIALGDLEQAETAAQRALAQERSARFRMQTLTSELEAARAALRFAGETRTEEGVLQLRAPVSGRILQRHFESARVVQPGEPILEIGDTTILEVEVDVLSSDAVRLEPGMRVSLERWGRPDALEARVRRVEPLGFTKISALGVEEQRVLVIADLISPPEQWDRLGHGYRVNARFMLWEAEDILRVPTNAVFRHGDGWALFTVHENRARLRIVEPGRRGGFWTQILSGVEQEEIVVVHPDRDLQDGVRVRMRNATDG